MNDILDDSDVHDADSRLLLTAHPLDRDSVTAFHSLGTLNLHRSILRVALPPTKNPKPAFNEALILHLDAPPRCSDNPVLIAHVFFSFVHWRHYTYAPCSDQETQCSILFRIPASGNDQVVYDSPTRVWEDIRSESLQPQSARVRSYPPTLFLKLSCLPAPPPSQAAACQRRASGRAMRDTEAGEAGRSVPVSPSVWNPSFGEPPAAVRQGAHKGLPEAVVSKAPHARFSGGAGDRASAARPVTPSERQHRTPSGAPRDRRSGPRSDQHPRTEATTPPPPTKISHQPQPPTKRDRQSGPRSDQHPRTEATLAPTSTLPNQPHNQPLHQLPTPDSPQVHTHRLHPG
jgi:hypothetical protein